MKSGMVAVILLFSAYPAHHLYASCGSATCPLDDHAYLGSGWLHFVIAHEYINQNRIYVGSSLSHVGAMPNSHDEVQTVNQRTFLDAQYGMTDRLSLRAEIPFIYRTHTHMAEGENETFAFSGLGDIVLGAQYAILAAPEMFDPYLSARVAVKLPTGVTDATSSGGELAEVTLQPGTGSLDALAGVDFRQNVLSLPMLSGAYGAVPFTAGLSYQVNGSGTSGYRIGNTLIGYIGTEYQALEPIRVLLEVNALVREYADVGSTDELRGNTGGTWVFASPGLAVRLGGGFTVSGYVQLPIYIDVHGIQQASSANFQLRLSADAGVFE